MSEIKMLEELREKSLKYAPNIRRSVNMALNEIEREIAERFMELPLDADGVPIKPGDIMQFRDDAPVRVDSIGNSKCYVGDFGWFGGNGGFYGKGTLKCCRHVKPRTVEDILALFLTAVGDDDPHYYDEQIAEYAVEIRELLRGDAE